MSILSQACSNTTDDELTALLDAAVEAACREWASYPSGYTVLRKIVGARSIKGVARTLGIRPERLKALLRIPPKQPNEELKGRLRDDLEIPLNAWE